MPALHTSALGRYVEDCKAAPGGYTDPDIVARYEPIDLVFDTKVDQTLSPYSDAYFEQQMSLYAEIAGRKLDQSLGELHSDDIEALRHQPNPTGIGNAATVAEYVRCVSSMLVLSCLEGRPTILDMGAGHGLGSEVLGYAGCKVHAVDIDPGLGALSRNRVAARDLDVTRFDLNFDDLGELDNNRYDGAYFFQALHHCLRPLPSLSRKARMHSPSWHCATHSSEGAKVVSRDCVHIFATASLSELPHDAAALGWQTPGPLTDPGACVTNARQPPMVARA